jgi:hypothetical protein
VNKRLLPRFFMVLVLGLTFVFAQAQAPLEPDQVSPDFLSNAHTKSVQVTPRGHLNGQDHARFGIFDIDSISNFNGQFFTDGFDSNGNPNRHWYTNTVGNPPQMGGTTSFNAPIVPVSLDLLDFDGSVRVVNGHPLHSDATPFVQPTVNSPVFQNFTYSSSDLPTQFTDAVQRAEFFDLAKSDWHTLLSPGVKTARTIKVPRGKYAFALNPDGTCCRFVLVDFITFVNLLFPAVPTDTTTPVGAAENAGDITTKDISTFLFPNTFLFFGNTSNCCVLGFHTFDFEPGDASNNNLVRFFVLNYSSWISPGIFRSPEVLDVLALSHEIAETFNDPFVAFDGIHDVTPWWLSPNGNCQNNLEVGDVIEGLPHETFPIVLNGFTYHPQNEALLQWFEFQVPSSALHGAYSYPDENVLTGVSAVQNAGCQ